MSGQKLNGSGFINVNQRYSNFSDNLNVSLGEKSGYKFVNILGNNQNVSTSLVDIWEGGTAAMTWQQSAENYTIVSDNANDTLAGTGARKLLIEGLDQNFNEISEIINLSGLTPVNTINQFLRMNKCNVIEVGTYGGFNIGTITISSAIAGIRGKIVNPDSQVHNSQYTVPVGYTAYAKDIHISLNQISGSEKIGVLQAYYRFNTNFGVKNEPVYTFHFGGVLDISDIGFEYVFKFPEKTDIWLKAKSTSGTVEAVSYYCLLLKKN